MKLKVFLVAGARPNFMKIAPLYDEMKKLPAAFEPIIVHTGQHYDENMSKVFFDDLELPRPDIYLGVGSGSHAEQTAEIMKRFEPQLLQHQPDLVLVVGDVNSTLACALTAVKMRMPSEKLTTLWQRYESYVSNRKITAPQNPRTRSHEAPLLAHVEAGERSFDFNMPEEINRVATDVLSDILFTTCRDSDENLLAEGTDPRKIFCVGNIMIDALQKFRVKAAQSNILEKVPLTKGGKGGYEDFVLVTLHRPGNVDDPSTLAAILSALVRISAHLPIIFPMHPRTRKLMANLDQTLPRLVGVAKSRMLIIEPLGYLDFLHLQTQARLVLTDSGGVQVETSYLGIPCLTLRSTTEWQITLREGTNQLVIPKEDEIVQAANSILSRSKFQPARIKFWDGHTAERIVEILQNIFHNGS